jgi:hypothetical protein
MEKSKLTETAKKKVRQVKGKVKNMLIISFNIKGIVHKEFVLAGQAVNFTYYSDVYGDCMKMLEDFALKFDNKRTGCCITTQCLKLPFSPGNF